MFSLAVKFIISKIERIASLIKRSLTYITGLVVVNDTG